MIILKTLMMRSSQLIKLTVDLDILSQHCQFNQKLHVIKYWFNNNLNTFKVVKTCRDNW